jgi:hypothetical protein
MRPPIRFSGGGDVNAWGYLSVDGGENLLTASDTYEIGYYDTAVLFQPGVPHYVTFGWSTCWQCQCMTAGAATVLIYKN